MLVIFPFMASYDCHALSASQRMKEDKEVPSTVSELRFLLTELSEIILYAAPGVFSDEGLDQAPRLLLILHIGVNAGNTIWVLKAGHIENMKISRSITEHLTLDGTSASSYSWCSTGCECRSNRGKECRERTPHSPRGNTDHPWIPCTASGRQMEDDSERSFTQDVQGRTGVNPPGSLWPWRTCQSEGCWWSPCSSGSSSCFPRRLFARRRRWDLKARKGRTWQLRLGGTGEGVRFPGQEEKERVSPVIFLTSMNLRMKLDSVKISSNILTALMWKTLFKLTRPCTWVRPTRSSTVKIKRKVLKKNHKTHALKYPPAGCGFFPNLLRCSLNSSAQKRHSHWRWGRGTARSAWRPVLAPCGAATGQDCGHSHPAGEGYLKVELLKHLDMQRAHKRGLCYFKYHVCWILRAKGGRHILPLRGGGV